jgi:hypothetical protein
LAARKSKEIQGNLLVFPWIPLAESGLFNELHAKKIKKSAACLTRVRGCAKRPAAWRPLALGHDPSGLRLLTRTSRVACEVISGELYTHISEFVNKITATRALIVGGPFWPAADGLGGETL